jgi:hypothetical protein
MNHDGINEEMLVALKEAIKLGEQCFAYKIADMLRHVDKIMARYLSIVLVKHQKRNELLDVVSRFLGKDQYRFDTNLLAPDQEEQRIIDIIIWRLENKGLDSINEKEMERWIYSTIVDARDKSTFCFLKELKRVLEFLRKDIVAKYFSLALFSGVEYEERNKIFKIIVKVLHGAGYDPSIVQLLKNENTYSGIMWDEEPQDIVDFEKNENERIVKLTENLLREGNIEDAALLIAGDNATEERYNF